MTKKVLVTGASGFIGKHCLPSLIARGYEVHAVTSKTLPLSPIEYITWHRADLLDTHNTVSLLADIQPSHLLHLAWFALPDQYWVSPENIRWVQASLTLFEEFARWQGRRLVVAGTCAEYDWRFGYCAEGVTPLAPSQLYGVCKHALHLMTDAWACHTELSLAWGRIFFLYGPHEYKERLVPSVIESLLDKQLALCSHGKQIRDYLYVEDAAEALVALLDSELQGAVNIASGIPLSVRDLVSTVADLLASHELIRFGARPASKSEQPLLVADVRRLTDELGWQPACTLESGLAQTIDWWKQQRTVNPQ